MFFAVQYRIGCIVNPAAEESLSSNQTLDASLMGGMEEISEQEKER